MSFDTAFNFPPFRLGVLNTSLMLHLLLQILPFPRYLVINMHSTSQTQLSPSWSVACLSCTLAFCNGYLLLPDSSSEILVVLGEYDLTLSTTYTHCFLLQDL